MISLAQIREVTSLAARTLWKRMWTRSMLTFLGFVVLSASFWLAVSLNETYEVEVAVPLELHDVPSNVVITTDLPSALHITLRDKGIRLLPYLYGGALKTISLNFRDHNSNGHGRIMASELQSQLVKQITNPTQIVRIKPDTLEFYYNYGASKRVPVRFDGEIRCQTGFFVTQTRVKPEFVTVYAPQSILDTLRYVNIKALHLTQVRDTVQRTQPIATPRGMKTVPSQVSVTVICDRLTEKTVRVPIHTLNFPASRVLRTFPSLVDVTFKVGVNQYDKVTADNFVIALGYEELLSTRSNRVRLSVRSVPDGVSDVRINPSTVDFVIENIPEEDEESIH